VITALTAQNSTGVQGVHLTPTDFLFQQLDSVLSDLPPAAIKTGMLPNAAAVEAVAAKLRQYYGSSSSSSGCGSSGGSNGGSSSQPPLVIDPVLISTSGHALASGGAGAALRDHLAPLATMLTPNITEAEALWGELVVLSTGNFRVSSLLVGT
jgi:hydroxymethylpyrimidine/phosphomethylpyrimidine kinase